MKVTRFTTEWAVWLGATLAGFAVIELRALKEPGAATLTSHVYHLFGFGDPSPWGMARRTAFYAAWGWVPLHVANHGPRCVACVAERAR